MPTKLVFSHPFTVAYEPLRFGELKPNEIFARTVMSGISHGTEMTAYTGTAPFAHRSMTDRMFVPKQDDDPFYPFRHAGYDVVAIVEKVGAGVTEYRPGDRIWAGSNHQTHVQVPYDWSELVKLDDAISNVDAIMINLTSIALTAVNDAELAIGDVVAVSGGGVVGQLAAQLAFVAGARTVYLIEPLEERRHLAQKQAPIRTIDPLAVVPAAVMRAENEGRGPDAIIECSGNIAALRTAIQAANVGGTVIAAGFYAGPATALSLGEEFLHNRITIKASMGVWGCPSRRMFWHRSRSVREAARLIAQQRVRFDGFVTSCIPFRSAQRAYDGIHREPRKHFKVVLTYDDNS